ncbi:MAG: hypothetical protein ACQESK_07860 [Bacteroidota bacterium]
MLSLTKKPICKQFDVTYCGEAVNRFLFGFKPKMDKKEDYFRISKEGHFHILSDRIPFNWKELMVFTPASFIFLIWFFGVIVGVFITIITLLLYTFFRFAAWIFYSEILIDEKSGKITRLKKVLHRTHKKELITQKFDPNQFEYLKLKRSGNTKYLLNYRTHKDNELVILRNKVDKELIEKYIKEEITFLS